MRNFLAFLATLAVVQCGHEGGLRARFGTGSDEDIGEKFYFDIPRNVSAAVEAGWTETPRPKGPMESLTLYCPDEQRIYCALYDDNGFVAGVQIASDQSVNTGQVLDWEVEGFTNWTVGDKNYWAIQQYFVDEEYLARSKEDRLASRVANKTIQLDSIWLTGFDGERVRIPTTEKEIQNKLSIFTQQACIPGMGLHYYYNLTTATECTSRAILPWLLVVHEGELVAATFSTTGVYPSPADGQRDWYERLTRPFLKMVAPYASECYYNYSDNPGVLSLHTFFVDKPWLITCPEQ